MGPNSILFGDGQIGGLATSSTKTARFNRNFYSGSARWIAGAAGASRVTPIVSSPSSSPFASTPCTRKIPTARLGATAATNINNQILNLENNIAGTAPGTVNNNTNKWTASLAATYQFGRESRLRGLSFGYGINGRGQRKVGSINPNILFNLPNGATATPTQNHTATFAYLYQPSFYTHDINIAYRKRIGKYTYRFQVNMNNVTDKEDLLFNGYVTYRVLGQTTNPLLGMFPSGYNHLDPRKIMLTTAIDF